jgi:hypothetical protein
MIYQTKCVCDRFQYGGCAGNANNFFTEGECLRTCAAKGTGSSSSEGSRDQEEISSAEMGVSRAQEVGVSRTQREGRRRPAMRDACLLPEDLGMKKQLLLYSNSLRDFLNIFQFFNPSAAVKLKLNKISC